MSNGKGSKPRNCFSKQFKDNYDKINWKSSDKNPFDMTQEEYWESLSKLKNLCPECNGIGSVQDAGMFGLFYKCGTCGGKGSKTL